MAAWTKVEAELAAVLVDDLRGRGWSVYQEVDAWGHVADIVATQGRALWVVECKLTLGLVVLGQAHRWIGHANLVSVAVLPGRRSIARDYALASAREFGIGVLEVRGGKEVTREIVRPRFLRRCSGRVGRSLHEKQKTYAAAGNANGKRYSSFIGTCDEVRRILADGPLTVRRLVARLAGRHHYASEASARGSILKWASAGKIEGVEAVIEPGSPTVLRVKA